MAASSLPNEIVERFSGIRLERQSAGSEINDESSVRKPINLAFQDGDKRTTQILPIKPRQYQVELYQQALKKNAIIYLGTGLGKTFITVMLIKSAQINEQIQLGRRVVFLAPTQELVKQQAEYIYRQVPYKVKVYCGRTCKTGLHIDSWDKDVWAAELTNYEVLFMIPAILKRALAINAISWKSIGLLIFDEVHHAASSKSERTGKSDGSEYSQILKHFDESHSRGLNNNESTKLIGLTASLINNGSRDHLAIANSIRALERKLHATCITDLTAIESKPRHVIWTYRTAAAVSVINKTLINLFSQYAERYEGTLNTKCLDRIITLGPQTDADRRMLAYHKRLNLASSGISIAPSSFPKILKQLEPICENSGLWTLANTCYSLVNAVDKHSKASCISDAIRPVYQEFGSILREVLSAINALMGLTSADLLFEHSQPKLLCLLEILRSEHARMVNNTGPKETFSCIVFVKSRIEVVAICNWLIKVSQQIPGYDFIRADYAIGLSAIATSELACITRRKSSEQSQMLDDFRLGVLNVIVTTSVLEEGIDLPVCSTVIRYDTAETFRVYVQSRGRARQQESSFVVISELGKSRETEKALHGFYDVEALIRKIMKKDDQRTQVSLTEYRAPIVNTYGVSGSGGRWADCDHEDCFRIPEKSIHISPAVARAVLNRYFSLLSRRRPYLGGLQHELKQVCGVLFRMTIFFPSGCPAAVKESVSGRPRRTIGAAGSSAVIAAFDALYKAGEIDCHGVPVQFTEDNIDKLLADYNMAPDFSKLSKHLEGEKVERGGKCYHQYEWKLCHLNDYNIYQKKPTKNQLYKLYRIVFTRRNDQSVRQETVGYFENPTIGIIVDASQDHLANLPVTIWSHYGEFKVEYNLIDDGFEIDDKAHKAYLVYTMSLMGTFWNLQDLSLVSFPEKCLFYFVPLSTSTDDISKTRLRGNFYKRNGIGRGAIVQMNKSHTNEENSTKRFLVHEIRTDMNAHSRIPGCQETFKERLERQDIQVKDPNQPVVMVYPISKEFGRTSHGKQVRSNDRTQPVYYLSQCFECVSFEPHEAYQAYNLPEIAYQIYINVLVLDLEKRFKRATASNRSDKVEFGQQSWQIANYDANVNDDTMAVSQDNLNGDCNTSDQLKTIRGNTMANKPNQTKENRPKTTIQFDNSDLSSLSGAEPETSHYYVGDELGSTYVSSSVSDSSAPATRGRDVMPAKQTQFDGCSSDSVTSGQMYLQMANLGRPTIERINFTPLLSQPKPSSSNVSSILALPHKTLAHQQRIEEILRNFHTGMIDLHQFMGEEQVYERLGHKVDLNIKPPLKFDTRPTNKPAGDVPLSRAFIEAITTRKASSHANLEALENIGDSFLKYFTSVQLFKYLGGDDQLDEGRLTSARSRLISNEHFSHLAKKNELGYYAINHKFDRGILNAVLGSYKLPVDNSLRLKDLADMFESLIGACLVYGGEYEAILAIKWLGLGHIIRADAFTRFQRHGVAFSRHQRATALARVDADELKRCMMQVMRFQSIIKYKFNDASYLVQAFTHASEIPRCTDSYERLEFLGDAILDFLVTMTLYDAGINKDPGQMTSSRSALVNNCTFAKLAIKYKFDIFIRQKNQQLFDELNRVNESAKSDPELKFLDIVDFDRISKTLADVFEAVAGAIYLDSGCSLDTVFSIYYPMLKDLIDEEIRKPTKNVIQQLYERFPGKDRIKFEFHQATGKDGKFVECAECFIDHLARGSSEGHSRKQAKMRAILKVMNNLPTIQS